MCKIDNNLVLFKYCYTILKLGVYTGSKVILANLLKRKLSLVSNREKLKCGVLDSFG